MIINEVVCDTCCVRTDPHAQRLARLQWELARRQELSQEVEGRETERDRSDLIIKGKEDKLRELGPQLAGILAQTVPVQKYLSLPLTYRRDQLELARLLPAPLYVMYCQCQAYSEACDHNLSVKVIGDLQEAVTFQEMVEDGDDDSQEGKDDSQDPDQEEKSRRSKKKTVGERESLARLHPLSVVLTVAAGQDRSVQMTCSWCLPLSVVTVEVEVSQQAEVVTGQMMMTDSLLAHITPGDSGFESPNPSTAWTLANQGIKDNIQKLLPGKLFYLWAQRLAGLDFLEATKSVPDQPEAQVEVSKLHMENIINSIKTRLESRADIQQQLDKLSQLKLDSSEAASSASLPVRTVSKLQSWQSLDWETYSQQPETTHLTRADSLVQADCFFYKATITRDKVTESPPSERRIID